MARLRQQQARDVGTRDGEHERHGAEQDPETAPYSANGILFQRLDHRCPIGIARRVFHGEAALHGREIGASLVLRDAFFQASYGGVEPGFTNPRDDVGQFRGQPHVDIGGGAPKTAR
jgi:hypothetical protein